MQDSLQLTQKQFTEVFAILRQVLGDAGERDRRARLIRTFGIGHPLAVIECGGDGDVFAALLVQRLQQFGHFRPNEEALWTLLKALREDLGLNWQERIDALEPALKPSAITGMALAKVDFSNERLLFEIAQLRIEFQELRSILLNRIGVSPSEVVTFVEEKYSTEGESEKDD